LNYKILASFKKIIQLDILLCHIAKNKKQRGSAVPKKTLHAI